MGLANIPRTCSAGFAPAYLQGTEGSAQSGVPKGLGVTGTGCAFPSVRGCLVTGRKDGHVALGQHMASGWQTQQGVQRQSREASAPDVYRGRGYRVAEEPYVGWGRGEKLLPVPFPSGSLGRAEGEWGGHTKG